MNNNVIRNEHWRKEGAKRAFSSFVYTNIVRNELLEEGTAREVRLTIHIPMVVQAFPFKIIENHAYSNGFPGFFIQND